MIRTKNGSAYYLIYGLFFLFVVGLIFVVFNQITVNNIRPVLEQDNLNFSQESKSYADKFMGVWALMPYVLVFIIMAWFIVWIGVGRGAE